MWEYRQSSSGFVSGYAFRRAARSNKNAGFSPEELMNSTLIDSLFIFMLACFIGFEVIRHVSPLLHTPLMSLTNALDAIAVVGAIVLVGERKSEFATVLGVIAIVAATSNVVGGFFITDRMLKMFKTSRPVKK